MKDSFVVNIRAIKDVIHIMSGCGMKVHDIVIAVRHLTGFDKAEAKKLVEDTTGNDLS